MYKYLLASYNFPEVIFAAILSAFFWLYGELSGALCTVCVLTLFDMITGIMRASVHREVESAKITRTISKIVGYSILLAALHLIFVRFLPNMRMTADSDSTILPTIITDPMIAIPYIVAALMILREGASIIENLVGAKILPRSIARRIGRAFKQVRDAIDESEIDDLPKE